MPISTFELLNFGECNTEANVDLPGSSLSRQDLAIYFTKNGPRKLLNSFTKVPYDFKFFMLSLQPGDNSFRGTKGKAIDYLREAIPSSPESIWVMLTNNITTPKEYMPLTPWILGHRFAHTTLIDRQNAPSNRPVFEAVKQFALDHFEGEYRNVFNADPGKHCFGDGDIFRVLCYFLITGRAAREYRLTNELEVFAEMTAQYLVTGKVTLVNIDQLLERIRTFSGRNPDVKPRHSYYLARMAEELEQLTYRGTQRLEFGIASLEKQINEGMMQFLDASKGRLGYF